MYRQASQEDLLTVGSGVVWDEKATCDGWLKFLGEVFEGDTALINYIQKLAGYWTTGLTKWHMLPVFIGQGRNARGVCKNHTQGSR